MIYPYEINHHAGLFVVRCSECDGAWREMRERRDEAVQLLKMHKAEEHAVQPD